MLLDLVASITGMVFPFAADFIKKKFLKPKQDTPEATISSLATTKPEVIPQYIEALSKLYDAQVRLFNRDRAGNVHMWVDDLRACIRPVFIIISLVLKALAMIYGFKIGSFRFLMEHVIASWFGCKAKTLID